MTKMTIQQYKQLAAGKSRPAAKGRTPGRSMNNLERKYRDHLDRMKGAGLIAEYWYESVNLRIGTDKCFYAPDFMVMLLDGTLEMHETKGRWEDDALVKIKVAADQFPFKFRAFQLVKGEWVERNFGQ